MFGKKNEEAHLPVMRDYKDEYFQNIQKQFHKMRTSFGAFKNFMGSTV